MQVTSANGDLSEFITDRLDSVSFKLIEDDAQFAEKALILDYIHDNGINVITREAFVGKGCVTDISKNEFVFMPYGVYIQIVEKGCGSQLQDGETKRVIARFTETNLASGSVMSNTIPGMALQPEVFDVSKNGRILSGSSDYSQSLIYNYYKSSFVPAAWILPFAYINIGRMNSDDDRLAKIRVIAPSKYGHQDAINNHYPCVYEITFEEYRTR